MVRVSPKAITWAAVEGSIRYRTKVTNANSLWVILSLRGRYPVSGLPRELQYPYYRGANLASLCWGFGV